MGTNMKSKESRRVCTHESEYVELNIHQGAVDDAAEMFLMGRDLHASNNVMEIGCDEIVFPWYQGSKRNCNQIKEFGCSIGIKFIQNLSPVLAVATVCPLA